MITAQGIESAARRAQRRWLRPAVLALGVLLAAAGLAGPVAAAPARYTLDPAHLTIAFKVWHVGFAQTLGTFNKADGSFVFDEAKPAVSDIQVTIDAASVDTNHEARDDHLRKEDFLWVAKHPTISFRGTGAEQTGPRTGRITGDLTLRGVTRPVTLDVTWNRSGEYPFGDKHWAAGISARTTIKRSEFGMTYATQGGLVGDEVEIILEFEAIRQPA